MVVERGERRGGNRAELVLLAGVLVLGLALRLWKTNATSLWLDDFHSLHHARAPGAGELLRGLALDNHPPLSFLLVGGARLLLGESQLALALPAVLAGVGSLVLLWKLLEGLPGRLPAVLFLSLSTLHLEASSNLRMYALLGFAVLGLIRALVRVAATGRGVIALGLFGTIGLHSHYQFLHAFLLLFAVALLATVGRPEGGPRRTMLAAGLGLAILLALPWYLTVFREQLAHGLAPGGSSVSLRRWLEGYLHLLFHGVGDHGAKLTPLFAAAGACAGLLALLGALRLLSTTRDDGRARAALLVACALVLPAWVAVAAWFSPRSGFDWRYLAGSSAPFAALAAVGCADGGWPLARARRLAGSVVAAVLLLLAVLVARHPGHEDYRSATRAVLRALRPGDAVLAVDWQPRLFPHGIGWRYYLERELDPGASPPPELAHDDDFSLVEGAGIDARSFERVHCILRSIPSGAACLRRLRELFPEERTELHGRGVHVVTFAR